MMINTMREVEFNRWFNYVYELWPDRLDVSEQYHFSTGGMRAPGLSNVHEQVDNYIEDSLGDEGYLASVIEFAVFTFFHLKIRELSIKELDKNIIDKEAVKGIINSYESWEIR